VLAEGLRDLTLNDLAGRLHCSKSTLYALGSSKEQLIAVAVRRFFRTATDVVEERTAAQPDAPARIVAYLRAVADALAPASPRFMDDLARHPAASEVYRRNTRLAAQRVSELVRDGVQDGSFRGVHAGFVADTVAATMERIQSGETGRATGLTDSQAYAELATLVLNGIRR
jgi:AcrR family transcriptional regulator